jgi:hypothetical protein
LARHVTPDRIESELLPHSWEQISHKFTERRILVADACGILSPYVKAELRPSLLLSMLSQLMEDKHSEVRSSIAINIARLIQSFDDGESSDCASKYYTIEEIVFKLLLDKNDQVIQITMNELIPTFITWCFQNELLFKRFNVTLFQNIENFVTRKLKYVQSSITDKILTFLYCIQFSIPYTTKYLIQNTKFNSVTELLNEFNNNNNSTTNNTNTTNNTSNETNTNASSGSSSNTIIEKVLELKNKQSTLLVKEGMNKQNENTTRKFYYLKEWNEFYHYFYLKLLSCILQVDTDYFNVSLFFLFSLQKTTTNITLNITTTNMIIIIIDL